VDNKAIIVYCQMTTATSDNKTCGDGGWTLVMKIDGNKVLPNYANVPLCRNGKNNDIFVK